ncbi:DUF2061 domain-containing protein [Aequorivita viscosa]|uniref:Uncharacterized membrane protein n=1 Tax=Aequorivita viscosa TaxID=797419 RepID=A0A1M6FQG5_9FLAO|nr:DUF2061 domain-containing protein [Aequorivita viscosa]SDW74449.1 Uncharacterized membrane protein [Aequorivita viscosa]SHI99913.1 Uncharacterized membrane protein [Aequorivita viscosa]
MLGRSRKRHIAKTITWRFVGTLDTILISWFITGDLWAGLKIGFAEVTTKMILYYLHERAWFKINLTKAGIIRESRVRHIAKALTWRTVGTLDTMMLSWIITGNPLAGLKIGLSELLTKTILYYIHERVWYKVNYGLKD